MIKGDDPSAARKALRRAYTVEDLCRWYLLPESETGRLLGRLRRPIKATTLAMDRSRISTHIVPLIGKQPVNGLTRGDIERMQADIIAGKTANLGMAEVATQQAAREWPAGQFRRCTPFSNMPSVKV